MDFKYKTETELMDEARSGWMDIKTREEMNYLQREAYDQYIAELPPTQQPDVKKVPLALTFQRGKNKLTRKLVNQILTYKSIIDPNSQHYDLAQECLLLKEKVKQHKMADRPDSYVMITVNYKDNDIKNLPEILKIHNKFLKRRMCKDFHYACIEQRSVDENQIYGIHSHFVIDRNEYKPSKLMSLIKNTFKNVCLVNNPQILNFKWFHKDMLEEKISYIKGIKKDDKMAKVSVDKIFRKQYNIPNFFSHNKLLTPIKKKTIFISLNKKNAKN